MNGVGKETRGKCAVSQLVIASGAGLFPGRQGRDERSGSGSGLTETQRRPSWLLYTIAEHGKEKRGRAQVPVTAREGISVSSTDHADVLIFGTFSKRAIQDGRC